MGDRIEGLGNVKEYRIDRYIRAEKFSDSVGVVDKLGSDRPRGEKAMLAVWEKSVSSKEIEQMALDHPFTDLG